MKNTLRLLLPFVFAGLFQRCSEIESAPALVEPANCTTAVMSYANDIQPIVKNACLSCHYEGSGNYDYARYEVLASRIRSNRLEERLLLPLDHPLHMPQGFEMNACNLYKFRLWINQGFPQN